MKEVWKLSDDPSVIVFMNYVMYRNLFIFLIEKPKFLYLMSYVPTGKVMFPRPQISRIQISQPVNNMIIFTSALFFCTTKSCLYFTSAIPPNTPYHLPSLQRFVLAKLCLSYRQQPEVEFLMKCLPFLSFCSLVFNWKASVVAFSTYHCGKRKRSFTPRKGYSICGLRLWCLLIDVL